MLQIKGENLESGELPTIFFGPKKPLSYILNPKSACTLALNFMFYLNHGYRYFDPIQIHYSQSALLRLGGSDFDPRVVFAFNRLSPESFTFVRDPLQRFVSGFLSKVFSDDDPLYLPYRDMLTSLHDVDLSPEADPAKSCLSFARWLASQEDQNQIDPHFRPQHLNLKIGGRFAIDTIIRLDDRSAVTALFTRWLGAEKASWLLSFRFNEHTKHSKDQIVTDELKGLVRKIYALDYDLFYGDLKMNAA